MGPAGLPLLVSEFLGLTGRQWVELVSALGYGVLSSIVPIFHTEAFIVAAVGAKLISPLMLSIWLAVGHTIGKQAMFLAVRHGKELPWVRKRTVKVPPEGSWRAKWQKWAMRTAHLVERPQWGYPILFVSSASGAPPVYPVVLLAGATKMSFWGFSVVLLVGFFIRCYVLALITLGAFNVF